MLLYAAVTLTLVGTALTAPAVVELERHHPAFAITEAFHHLEKRQSDYDALSSFQDLLEKAVGDARRNGECSSECSGWMETITDCANLGGSYTDIGYCSCGETSLTAMKPCGFCYGGSSTTDSDNFSSFCPNALASIGGGSASAAAPSQTSQIPFTSATAPGASQSSYSSRASPTMILDTEIYSAKSTTSSPQESASNAGNPSPAPGSGAGSIKIDLGMIAGVVGCAGVALFA